MYAKLDTSAIFPKHILQYGGNAETEQGFGTHGMSRASLCRVGRHLAPYNLPLRNRKYEANTTQAVTMVLGL